MDIWKKYKRLFGGQAEELQNKVNVSDLGPEKSLETLKPLTPDINFPPLNQDFYFAVSPFQLSMPTDKIDMPSLDEFADFELFFNDKNTGNKGSVPGYEDAFDNPAHLQVLLEHLLKISELSGRNFDAQIPKTADDRKKWLEENFGRVEVIPSGKDFVVAMPEGYSLDFRGQTKTRMRCTAKRLEVTADSPDESIGNLYNLVCRNQHVNLYKPKPGQDESALIPGREYFIIKKYDPLHDHASKDLIDFTINDIGPFGNRVSKGSLEGMHSHLLDPKLV